MINDNFLNTLKELINRPFKIVPLKIALQENAHYIKTWYNSGCITAGEFHVLRYYNRDQVRQKKQAGK